MSNQNNTTEYDFIKLVKQNIKNNIEEKGENKMPKEDENQKFKFPSGLVALKNERDKTEDVDKTISQSAIKPSFPPAEKINKINQNKQESFSPTKQQVNSSQSVNNSDFEKFKEDLVKKFDNKMVEFENMFNNKLEDIDRTIANFDTLIIKLNNSSTTYNEVNTLIEKLGKENINIANSTKEELGTKINDILNFLKKESSETNDFIEKHLNKKDIKETVEYSSKKTTEYKNEEDDEEDDDNYNREPVNEDEDDNVFSTEGRKKPEAKIGLLGKIFKKLGL